MRDLIWMETRVMIHPALFSLGESVIAVPSAVALITDRPYSANDSLMIPIGSQTLY